MRKMLVFYGLPKRLSTKEKESFFDVSFEKIKNKKMLEYHIKAQNNIIKALKNLYLLNSGEVYFKFFYFDTLDDFYFFNKDKGLTPEIINVYTSEEVNKFKKLFLRLSGKELILKKPFKIKNFEELEILIKFQLRTFRTILIYFKNLHCIVYGRDEYVYNIHGKYKNESIYKILQDNELTFFEDNF